MHEEILNTSVAAGLTLCVYTIVDKVVVPLVRKRSENEHGENRRRGNDVQSVLNDQLERRIEGLENDCKTMRDTLATVCGDVQETKAILERI